jgi:tetratricopeptide (TPR) repeat protein
MDLRKWALVVGVAASCTGCVTETKTITGVPTEALPQFQNRKPEEFTKQEIQPQTYVALGYGKEGAAGNPKLSPMEQQQSRDEARQLFQKAISVDPKCVEAHIALANWYAKQNDFDRALAVYQNATKAIPNSARLWSEEGVLLSHRKDFPNAVVCLGKAHEIEPQNRILAAQYGLCLAYIGRHQEGAVVLSSVMSKADAYYNVARCMDYQHQPELCWQYTSLALQDRPTHGGALQLMARFNNPGQAQGPQNAVAVNPAQSDPNFQPASYQQSQ